VIKLQFLMLVVQELEDI